MTTTETLPKQRVASFEFCENAGRRGTNFLHAGLMADALRVSLNTPRAPRFSEEEINAGFARGEQLIWFPSKDADGASITMQRLYETFGNKAPLGGKLLRGIEWYMEEMLFTEETARADQTGLGLWLAGTSAVPGTKGENYLRQTVTAAAYLYDTVYDGTPPESLRKVLAEPAEREAEISALVDKDWEKGGGVLVGLAFNQLFREPPIEAFLRVLVNQQINKTRVLESEDAWTNRRSRRHRLVSFGDADEDGADLDYWSPGLSFGNLGFFLSRSETAGRES